MLGLIAQADADLAVRRCDGDGNLTRLQRNDREGSARLVVDNLAYAYAPGTNRLASVSDTVAPTAEAYDVESGALTYDPNGNALSVAPLGLTAAAYDWRNLPTSMTRGLATTGFL